MRALEEWIQEVFGSSLDTINNKTEELVIAKIRTNIEPYQLYNYKNGIDVRVSITQLKELKQILNTK